MYKDVKKKLLSVALCICMIIGLVQVVPRAKAAATVSGNTITVSGTNRNEGTPISCKVTVDDVSFSYNGGEQKPKITGVKINGIAVSLDGWSTELDAGDNGTIVGAHSCHLKTPDDYIVTEENSRFSYSIKKASIDHINVSKAADPVVWTVGGTKPNLTGVEVFSTASDAIKLDGTQYTVDAPTGTGGLTATLTVTDSDNFDLTQNTTTSVSYNVAYSLKGKLDGPNIWTEREMYISNSEVDYDGTVHTPKICLKDKDGNVTDIPGNINFMVSYYKGNDPVDEIINAGTYTVHVSAKNNYVQKDGNYYTDTFVGEFRVIAATTDGLRVVAADEKQNNASVTVYEKGAQTTTLIYTYNGSTVPLKDVRVYDGTKDVTDYFEKQYNPTNPIAGSVVLTLKPKADSNYSKNIDIEYFITSDLSIKSMTFQGKVAGDYSNLVYTGQPIVPLSIDVVNADGGTVHSYTVIYKYVEENDIDDVEFETADANDPHLATPGEKKVVVVGTGNYDGFVSKPVSYTVLPIDMGIDPYKKDFTLTLDLNKSVDSYYTYYKGSKWEPKTTLIYKKGTNEEKTLVEGTDYTVSYENNINVGNTASVTVTGKSGSGYTGSLTVPFSIYQLDLQDAQVVGTASGGAINDIVYTGEAVVPTIRLSSTGRYEYTLQRDDFDVVGYETKDGDSLTSAPVNVGEYKITIKKKNTNIKGDTVTLDYKIVPQNLADIGFTLQGVTDGKIEWWGKDTKPTIVSALTPDVDYTFRYENCDRVGTGSAIITAVTPGNYMGTKTLSYGITPRDLSRDEINASAVSTPNGNGTFKVNLNVADTVDDKTTRDLIKDTDYTVTKIEYLTDPANYSPAVTDIDALTKAGEYEITLSGNGKYGGQKTVRVGCGKDISGGKISLKMRTPSDTVPEGTPETSFIYNAKQQQPKTLTITLPSDGSLIRYEFGGTQNDFNISFRRTDNGATVDGDMNVNAGDVYVVATGNPEKGYYGTTTLGSDGNLACYRINPLDITKKGFQYKAEVLDALEMDNNGLPQFIFNSSDIRPDIKVSKDNANNSTDPDVPESLTEMDNQIVITYPADCRNVGQKYVSIKGIGNYTGEFNTRYRIAPMDINSNDIEVVFDDPSDHADGVPRLSLYLYSVSPDTQLIAGTDYTAGPPTWEPENPSSTWENVCVYNVTGKNNFTGSRTCRNIMDKIQMTLAEDNAHPKEGEVFIAKWDMSELLIDPTVKPLTQKRPKNFTLAYMTKEEKVRNLKINTDYRIIDAEYGTNTQPGSDANHVKVEGMGGFSGKLQIPLTFYTDIGKAKFAGIDGSGSELYEGAKISVKRLSEAIETNQLSNLVTFEKLWTDEGSFISSDDYTVKLPNDYTPHMGDLTVTVEGSPKEPYYYSGTKTFMVRVTDEINDQMEITIGSENTVQYEGKEVLPKETSDKAGDGTRYSVYSVSGGQRNLLKGVREDVYDANPDAYKDYDYTISFSNNTKIGLATANIKGINDYSGTVPVPFKIVYPYNKLTVQIGKKGNWQTSSDNIHYTYNPKDPEENKPLVQLYYTAEGTLPEEQWELIDVDFYGVTYEGYNHAGDAKILIGTPGNADYEGILTGNPRTVYYTLDKIQIGGDDSPVALQMERRLQYTGNAITAENGLELVLMYDGYELVKGTDYTVGYENNLNASTDQAKGKVAITGKGNFEGGRVEEFEILRMLISSPTDIAVNIPKITYTGTSEKPRLQISQTTGRTRILVENTDYEIVEYRDGANRCSKDPFSAVGSYFVIVKGLGNYDGIREIPYEIIERGMNDGVEVTFENSEYCPVIGGVPNCVYDGKEHKPVVRVRYNGIVLNGPEQTAMTPDYTLDYTNNVNAGTATIIITGENSFNGTKEVTFQIQQKDISGEDIQYLNVNNEEYEDEKRYDFTSNPVEPVVKVRDNGMPADLSELREGEDADYTIIYEDHNDDKNGHYNAGEVTMTFKGQGNYGGEKVFTYYIGEDISRAYTLVNGKRSLSVEYNGLVQAPKASEISVEVSGSENLDLITPEGEKRYAIQYFKDGFKYENRVNAEDFVNAGTYYVAVVGVPELGTYAKSSEQNTCTYKINPRSISPSYVLVSGYDGTYYYTGQAIQPRGITVEDTDLPVTDDEMDPQRRTVKLINGTDYDLSYTNNVAAGKASIIVTGKGNYTGSRVAYFNILSSAMDGNNTWDGSSEGTGSISNGSTTISASDIILGFDNSQYNCMMYNGYERIPTVTINGISTSEFIITASNNIRPGVATLTIIGRGNNFTGTIIKNYKIKANLSAYGSIASIEDQVYTGYQITPHVTLTCGGNLLNQGRDYTLTYLNNTAVGKATVMATATNDSYYIGTASGSFNISNTAGGMELTGYASSYTYTGYAITPDIVVTMNGRVLNRGTDYVVSYSNNTNVGTATMTVTGIGSFSGTKTINYTIEAKNIENCLTTAVNSYQYTGNTYTPSISVTDSFTGKTLVAGTDYTITYSNNTNPGTASITVTALSKNYSGSKVIPFKIISAAVSGLRVGSIKNNSVKLSWTPQDYADGYQICNSSNRVIATTSKNSYTIKKLTSCTTYRFKVRSYVENADGSISYGNFSTAVSAKTLLNTPTLKARSTSRGRVTLTWSKVSKATGYEIYYSTKKNGVYTRLKTVSKSSARKYVDKGLASGEKYYYTIRAYRTTNGVKTYSSYNTIKSVKVK